MALKDLVDTYDWEGSADDLEVLMRDFYPDIVELSAAYAAEFLPGISFDLTNPKVQEMIDARAALVRNVANTTRDDIKRWIEIGTKEGLSIEKIAEQITSKGAGVSRSRARTIARTETREAYNGGAILYYDEAGVKKVRALDSDDDPECAERNGKVYTLEDAASIEAHPNCVLAWEPVVE